ncbi:tetratricopeptide repeat protein [Piscinibacter terrae]|uniref:Uncharacterized protein n=1 Tax=Piscinibacter terrae TaxID=2496871 RepID=A0A3N7HWW5_9BURK|nr:tetratricopeptide repeat protein [Albitalea terrae]RQP25541.1 hypothetical protein DZC73_00185 [Albitalea terrae]
MKTSSVSRIIVSVVIAVAAMSAFAGSKEDIQADMKAGRWSQADTRLTDVLAKHPDNALAHYWQAQVKFRENQLDEARKHLSAAKELDPQFKFASDKASLSKLEAALDKPAPAPTPRIDNPTPKQTMPATVERSPVTPYKEPKSSGGSGWLWIGLIVLVVFIFWAVRSAKSRGMSGDKAAIKGKLEEALNDLRDAGKFIDTRSDLTMEQKLAMSDRVMRAQGDVQAHLATLATRDDLQPSIDLWRRVRDIAAETRGERRPSEIEAEREMELQRMRSAQMANQNMGMGVPNQGGSGFGGAGAALGGLAAGVVLGSMMSGGAQAHERRDSGGGGGGSGGYTPIEDFDRGDSSPSIDVGGSGDGGGWDSGSSDTGGGGSDSFD